MPELPGTDEPGGASSQGAPHRMRLASLLRARRTRRALPAVVALAAVAVAAGVIVGAGEPETSRGATRTRQPSGSATVQRRDLVATDTEAGTLGYADPETVFNRLSGTITWLPHSGAIIKPGQQLYQVSGQPVILLDGTVPAYRSFAAGMSAGADVAELKQNLVALGFDPDHAITVNATFDGATVAAIDRWQASLGETQTGQIPLGDVVFLRGPRRVDSVSGVLGSTGGGGGGSAGSGSSANGTGTGASYTPLAAPRTEFVSFTTTTPTTTPTSKSGTPATTSTTPTTTTRTPSATPGARTTPAGAARPSSSGASRTSTGGSGPSATQLLSQLVAELKRLSSGGSGSAAARSGSSSGSGGTGAATAIMQTTSTDLVVTVNLDATKQSEATVGEPVTVQLPDGSTTNGRITAVSSVAQSSSSNSGSGSGGGGGGASSSPSATVPVTIALTGRRHVQGLDQAAVSVNFQQQVERGVLSVPVTALVATAGGGYAVQTVGAGPSRLIPVTPGLFAGGYVQVSGAGLVEGMRVSDSQG